MKLCERSGSGVWFEPKKPASKYCSDGCLRLATAERKVAHSKKPGSQQVAADYEQLRNAMLRAQTERRRPPLEPGSERAWGKRLTDEGLSLERGKHHVRGGQFIVYVPEPRENGAASATLGCYKEARGTAEQKAADIEKQLASYIGKLALPAGVAAHPHCETPKCENEASCFLQEVVPRCVRPIERGYRLIKLADGAPTEKEDRLVKLADCTYLRTPSIFHGYIAPAIQRRAKPALPIARWLQKAGSNLRARRVPEGHDPDTELAMIRERDGLDSLTTRLQEGRREFGRVIYPGSSAITADYRISGRKVDPLILPKPDPVGDIATFASVWWERRRERINLDEGIYLRRSFDRSDASMSVENIYLRRSFDRGEVHVDVDAKMDVQLRADSPEGTFVAAPTILRPTYFPPDAEDDLPAEDEPAGHWEGLKWIAGPARQ